MSGYYDTTYIERQYGIKCVVTPKVIKELNAAYKKKHTPKEPAFGSAAYEERLTEDFLDWLEGKPYWRRR